MRIFIFCYLLILFTLSCKSAYMVKHIEKENTADINFDIIGSDKKAIDLADSVMNAMGGRYNWDNTHFLKWNFFGKRELIWDKFKNRVRIDITSSNTIIISDLKTGETKLEIGKKIISDKDSLVKYAQKAKAIWINDSYWLVMPFKMKDAGVTLKYIGRKENSIGAMSEVVSLTFKNTGNTPDNKYYIYINPRTFLVTQWDFYKKSEDLKPEFSNVWQDYKAFDRIFLSGNRGSSGYISNIRVYKKLPESIFKTFGTIDWTTIK